jgi:hypothetical protein
VSIAIRLAALGEHEQARALAEDTLTRRRVLGDDHPATLTSAHRRHRQWPSWALGSRS